MIYGGFSRQGIRRNHQVLDRHWSEQTPVGGDLEQALGPDKMTGLSGEALLADLSGYAEVKSASLLGRGPS